MLVENRMCNNVLTCIKNVCCYHEGSTDHCAFSSYDVVYVIVEHSKFFYLQGLPLILLYTTNLVSITSKFPSSSGEEMD